MARSKTRLIVAIIAGVVFAGLTVLVLDHTEISGGPAAFMAPGLYIAATITTGSIFPNTWLVAAINFAFDFGLSYLVMMIFQKLRT